MFSMSTKMVNFTADFVFWPEGGVLVVVLQCSVAVNMITRSYSAGKHDRRSNKIVLRSGTLLITGFSVLETDESLIPLPSMLSHLPYSCQSARMQNFTNIGFCHIDIMEFPRHHV
jgi:hypothetical protein